MKVKQKLPMFALVLALVLSTMPVSAAEVMGSRVAEDDDPEVAALPIHQEIHVQGHLVRAHFGDGHSLIVTGDGGDKLKATVSTQSDGISIVHVRHGSKSFDVTYDWNARTIRNGHAFAREFAGVASGTSVGNSGPPPRNAQANDIIVGSRTSQLVDAGAADDLILITGPDGVVGCIVGILGFLLASVGLIALEVSTSFIATFAAVAAFELAAGAMVWACGTP